MDFKDVLVNAQKKSSVAYNKFILEKNKFENVIVCFVEGKDSPYYKQRIERITGYDSKDIIIYSCDGRNGVENIKNKITQTEIDGNDIKIMYFADTDYDIHPKEHGIFYTDYYSIENYYCRRETIEKIVHNIFNTNIYDSNFSICMSLYDERYTKYQNEIIKVNAYCYAIRKKEYENGSENRVDLKKIKWGEFRKNRDFDDFEMKNLDYNKLKDIFGYVKIEVSEEEYREAIEMIDLNKHRGKWEIEFFSWVLNGIKECINKEKYGLEKKGKIKVDFCAEPLLVFSNFAETTQNLIDYINNIVRG